MKKNVFLSTLGVFKDCILSRLMYIIAFVLFVISGLSMSFLISNLSLFYVLSAGVKLVPAWVLLVLAVYCLNDIFDRETDEINGRDLPLSSKNASLNQIIFIVGFSSFSALILTGFINLEVFLIAVGYLLLGVLYSVPYIKLKDRLLGKPFTVAMGIVLSLLAVLSVTGLCSIRDL